MRYGESLNTGRKSRPRSFRSSTRKSFGSFDFLHSLFIDFSRFFNTLNFSSVSGFFYSLKTFKSFRSFRSGKQDFLSGFLLIASALLLGWRIFNYASEAYHNSPPYEESKPHPTRGYLYAWTSPQFAHKISMSENLTYHEAGSSLVGRVTGPFSRVTISAVAAGEHTLVVTSNGALFSFGRDWNDEGKPSGQLGRGGRKYNPIRVRGVLAYKTVVAVAVGMYHSVAVTRDGKVFTWGLNRRGQLGRVTEKKTDENQPGPVLGVLEGKKVIQVAAGRAHTLALTSDGKVYTWGLNYFTSQLVVDQSSSSRVKPVSAQMLEMLATPRLVTGAFVNNPVLMITSGPDHWLALTHDKRVYSSGTGYGPDEFTSEGFSANVLGRHAGEGSARPGKVTGPFDDQEVTFIAAGPGSSYAISETVLYSWGDFSANIARNDPSFPPDEPAEAGNGSEMDGENIEEVSAGHGFAIARSIEGKIYTWGRNDDGQLGRPGPLKDIEPRLMDSLMSFQIVSLAAGSHFGMAICHHPSSLKPEDDIDRLVGMKVVDYPHGNFPSIVTERHRDMIMRLEKGLFARIPPDGYDHRFKNPCWFEKPGGFFCLPYFFITGSSRCGVADLYARVAESHLPGVMPLQNKNPNWWDLSDHGVDWYLDFYKEASEKILKNPTLVTGESSPNMMMHSGLAIHGKPNQVDLSELLFAFLPGARLVIMLRDPVDRYHSAFYHYDRQSGKSFSQKASEDIRVMKKCLETFDPHSCINNMHTALEHLVKSMYAYPLENWLRVYAQGERLVLRFEDYVRDVRGTVLKVLKFLDLQEPSVDKLTEIAMMPVLGKETHARPQMSQETRDMLNQFFAPHNQKLAQLVEDDAFLWKQ